MIDGLNQRQRDRKMLSEENGVKEWLESWAQVELFSMECMHCHPPDTGQLCSLGL